MDAAAETLAALRTAVARIEANGTEASDAARRLALGPDALDAALGGGLRRGALHAVAAASASGAASATGFAAALAGRAAHNRRAVLWIRQDMAARETGELWGPGLGPVGLDPSRLILLRAPDLSSALKAAEAGLSSPALAATVIEPFGACAGFDRVAGRRLALAAGRTGGLALMLRLAGSQAASPAALPAGFAAAETRWSVAPLASAWSAAAQDEETQDWEEDELCSRPQALVELVRNRQGGLGRWPLAWGFDDGLFRLAERRAGALDADRPDAGTASAEAARARAAEPADRPRPAAGAGPVRRAG